MIYLEVNGEKIITMPDHLFYVPGKGWTVAGQLYVGSKLLLYNGEEVFVYGVRAEYLQSEVSVYNFEVADWHTYFVSESSVLVHNDCGNGTLKSPETFYITMSKSDYNTLVKISNIPATGETFIYPTKSFS